MFFILLRNFGHNCLQNEQKNRMWRNVLSLKINVGLIDKECFADIGFFLCKRITIKCSYQKRDGKWSLVLLDKWVGSGVLGSAGQVVRQPSVESTLSWGGAGPPAMPSIPEQGPPTGDSSQEEEEEEDSDSAPPGQRSYFSWDTSLYTLQSLKSKFLLQVVEFWEKRDLGKKIQ